MDRRFAQSIPHLLSPIFYSEGRSLVRNVVTQKIKALPPLEDQTLA